MITMFAPRNEADARAQIAQTRVAIARAQRWLIAQHVAFIALVAAVTWLCVRYPHGAWLLAALLAGCAFTLGAVTTRAQITIAQAKRTLASLEAFLEASAAIRSSGRTIEVKGRG